MHLITQYIRTSATNVFAKMLKQQLDVMTEIPESEVVETPLDGIAGAVSFTGALNGTVYLLLSERYALVSTLKLFGEKRCARADLSGDFVGELTNMVTGYVKSRLGDRGLECKLTPPTIIRGKELTLNAMEPSLSLYNQFEVRDANEKVHIFVFVQIELNTWKTGLMEMASEDSSQE